MPDASRRIGFLIVASSMLATLAVWLVPSQAEPPAPPEVASAKSSDAAPATPPSSDSPPISDGPRLPDAPPILEAPPTAAPINTPQLLEILELRRQRGSILDGSILDQPNDETPANDLATFQESLKNVAAQEPADAPPNALPNALPQPAPHVATEDERLAALLLRAGRALDRRANRYEREADAVEAKRLRALADSLRATLEALPSR
ncbi:MAG: hypothetical protein KDA59_13830 [Planctomycetales bacterium]|nr:hypothetical protein [Planctomycetales bacterium]